MIRIRICLALLLALAAGGAMAQPAEPSRGLLEKTQSWLDNIGRGMRRVGETAEDLFGPGMALDGDTPAAHTEERDFHERREVGPSPLVAISNEFAEIHVDAWDERVVQVNAKVIVGAESASVAQEISRSISVNVTQDDGLVQVQPVLPDRHLDMGAASMQVNLYVTIPRGADLAVDNYFGDTYVRGAGGRVALESQYGIVDLNNLGGAVQVRARGEFPLRAQGLKLGGLFQLHGSQALFADFGGALRVNSFGGRITLEALQPEAEIDVVAESGPIRLVLPAGSTPDLTASAVYGSVDSELPVTRSERGRRILARHGSPDARQRIDLSATFGGIEIAYEGSSGEVPATARSGDKPFSEPISRHETVTPYTRIQIEAIRGDIQLIGTDEPGVHISANPIVWVPSASKAPAALDALPLRIQKDADRLIVRTLLTGDMEALQCSEYRVLLKIEYPRNLPVTVLAEDGHTQVTESAGAVTIEQSNGAISAARAQGPLALTNKNGSIRVSGGSGQVTANARYGDTVFEAVQGDIDVACLQGNTVIDRPGGAVNVRNSLGNVRILATGGIAGDHRVLVEDGDLSVVLGEATYAALDIAVEQGAVDSAIPLDGRILGRRKSEWRGYPRYGQYGMKLEARNGDIILD
ncbi:MAG: hypothetical protein KF886_21170 [Candidatus Hydrogenedentes bacterium]|nr:hypothetical protein [Candidatus Hydrogenedentota bacterium]